MEKITVYKLEFAIPKEDRQQIKIGEKITVGSDPSADVVIQKHNLSPVHLIFQQQNDILNLTMLGEDHSAKIGSQKLLQGKMYLLEKGDKLAIGKIKMSILQEEVEMFPEDESEESDAEGEETSVEEMTESGQDFLEDGEGATQGRTAILKSLKGRLQKERSKSLDSRISKRMEHKASKEKVPSKKSRSLTGARVKPPGFFARFFGLNVEIFLALSLFPLAFEIALGENWNQQIHQWQLALVSKASKLSALLPLGTFIPEEGMAFLKTLNSPGATSLFAALVFFVSLRLLSALLFSAPLPLFLMGVTHRGGHGLGKRGIAFLREVLGFVTFPFLVFDLPLLLSRRSFKEVVTCSHLGYSHPLVGLGGGAILNPLLVAAVFLFPVDFDPYQFPVSVDFTASALRKPSSVKSPQKTVLQPVYEWGYQFKTSLSPDWIVLPLLKREGRNWRFDLFITDAKSKQELKLRRGKTLDYSKKIHTWGRTEPLLAWHSPLISAWSFGEQKSEWTIGHVHEWAEIVESSLRLSFTDFFSLASLKGPVMYPYAYLRKELLQLLEFEGIGPEKISSFRFGAHSAFAFPSDTSTKILVLRGLHFETWMAGYQSKKADLSLLNLQKLFRFAKQVRRPASFRPEQIKNWNGFAALDVMAIAKKEGKLSKDVTSRLLRFFIQSAYKTLKSTEVDLHKKVILAFKNYDRFLLGIVKKTKDANLKDLRLSLVRTQKALQNKELQYFRTNLR